MKRKVCPLLVQSETNPSLTIQGQSWTRTWFSECIGEKCAAYKTQNRFCDKWECTVSLRAEADHTEFERWKREQEALKDADD